MPTCKHKTKHTEYKKGSYDVYFNMPININLPTITTYCADCGKKLKVVKIEE